MDPTFESNIPTPDQFCIFKAVQRKNKSQQQQQQPQPQQQRSNQVPLKKNNLTPTTPKLVSAAAAAAATPFKRNIVGESDIADNDYLAALTQYETNPNKKEKKTD